MEAHNNANAHFARRRGFRVALCDLVDSNQEYEWDQTAEPHIDELHLFCERP